MELNEKITSLLENIEAKYKMDDQEFSGYLEGLLYQDYLNYWDYINLDALLNLQHRRTNIPDEMIFIIYHQITELYFKLCLWEYDQILSNMAINGSFIIERVKRINAYFVNLTRSFEIMIDGMEPEQFLKFRLSLLPASGFQSAQYRMIELASTDLINLVHRDHRKEVENGSIEEQYRYIYWKYGATIIDTGKKSLTLRKFEEKYAGLLQDWAEKRKNNNLLTVYKSLPDSERNDPEVMGILKKLDSLVNVEWPLVHYKSAARYLIPEKGAAVAATGGTNWQQYLPPRFQRRVFFPEFWTKEELESWGRPSKES